MHIVYKKTYKADGKKKDIITVYKVRKRIIKQAKDKVEKAKNILRKAEIIMEKKEKARVTTQKSEKPLFKEVKIYLKAKLQLVKLFT